MVGPLTEYAQLGQPGAALDGVQSALGLVTVCFGVIPSAFRQAASVLSRVSTSSPASSRKISRTSGSTFSGSSSP